MRSNARPNLNVVPLREDDEEPEPEVWRPVLLSDHYQVSTLGNVRSTWRMPEGEWRILRQAVSGNGYLAVGLFSGTGERRTCYTHKLLLVSFCGPPGLDQECRHLNGQPTDNRLSNLRWGTRAERIEDMRRHGTLSRGERNGHALLTAEKVSLARRLNREGVRSADLARLLGVGTSTMWAALRGVTWSHVEFEA